MEFMNIFEHQEVPSALIIGDFSVMIDAISRNSTTGDIKPFVEKRINETVYQFEKKALEDIKAVNYTNITGYTASG